MKNGWVHITLHRCAICIVVQSMGTAWLSVLMIALLTTVANYHEAVHATQAWNPT